MQDRHGRGTAIQCSRSSGPFSRSHRLDGRIGQSSALLESPLTAGFIILGRRRPVMTEIHGRRAALYALSLDFAASLAHGADYGNLPRRDSQHAGRDEVYPGVAVLYDSIQDAAGERLRIIATHPERPSTHYPTIF